MSYPDTSRERIQFEADMRYQTALRLVSETEGDVKKKAIELAEAIKREQTRKIFASNQMQLPLGVLYV